eukprot:gene25387-31844_t
MESDVLDAPLVRIRVDRDQLRGVLRLEHEPAALRQKQPHRMPLTRASHAGKFLGLKHDHLRRRRSRRMAHDPRESGHLPQKNPEVVAICAFRAAAETLGEKHYAEQHVKILFGLATKAGLSLNQGEYKFSYDKASRVTSYQITLPVKGSYQAIWQFALTALRELPFAALDDIGFRRENIGDTQLEARPEGRRRAGAAMTPRHMLMAAALAAAAGLPKRWSAAHWGLQPAMSLNAQIIAVQQLQAGDSVGYGSSFVADGPMRIGVVACGYADGYPRICPTGTPVLVDGVRGRTVGRVSMDMLTVDLSPFPDAGVGSTVTLWGQAANGGVLSIDEVAQAAGTVGYELMCALAQRVPVAVD